MTAPTAATRPRPVQHRSRPLTEYWDVFTASWRRNTPTVPQPRSGD
jgi:hypothetical protein